jgi:hypothetical protein
VIYSLVHDGYDVELYRSRRTLAKAMAREAMCLERDSETPSTEKEIWQALGKERIVRFYKVDASDWTYRAEQQPRLK